MVHDYTGNELKADWMYNDVERAIFVDTRSDDAKIAAVHRRRTGPFSFPEILEHGSQYRLGPNPLLVFITRKKTYPVQCKSVKNMLKNFKRAVQNAQVLNFLQETYILRTILCRTQPRGTFNV